MNKIQQILDEDDRSQMWLAKKIGRAKGTVNSWCQNIKQPKLDDLIVIANLFNISVYELTENNRPERVEVVLKDDEE